MSKETKPFNAPGQPYRPSNGTDGELFAERYCDNCRHNGGCGIYAAAFLGSDDPAVPVEWVYDDRRRPTCTEFERVEGEVE